MIHNLLLISKFHYNILPQIIIELVHLNYACLRFNSPLRVWVFVIGFSLDGSENQLKVGNVNCSQMIYRVAQKTFTNKIFFEDTATANSYMNMLREASITE